MKASHELSKIFEEELERVLAKEVAEPDYLPHEDFNNSLDRSEAIMEAATEVCKKILAVSIAKHRKDKHNEDTDHEVVKYSEGLEPEQLEITTQEWWQG